MLPERAKKTSDGDNEVDDSWMILRGTLDREHDLPSWTDQEVKSRETEKDGSQAISLLMNEPSRRIIIIQQRCINRPSNMGTLEAISGARLGRSKPEAAALFRRLGFIGS